MPPKVKRNTKANIKLKKNRTNRNRIVTDIEAIYKGAIQREEISIWTKLIKMATLPSQNSRNLNEAI